MAIGKDSLRPWLHGYPMQIQKRTMNWLPKAGVYQEMQNNRAKMKAANARVDASAANAAAMIGSNTDSTEAVNLTLRMAAARVRTGIKPKV
jgi:hypothetical protein